MELQKSIQVITPPFLVNLLHKARSIAVDSKRMAVTKEVLAKQLAAEDPKLCRDKAVELLREGKATESAEW